MDIDRIRRDIEDERWTWFPAVVVGLAALTLVAGLWGDWVVMGVASLWVIPLTLGYEMMRPTFQNALADRVAAYTVWILTLAPWLTVLGALTAVALVPSVEGISISFSSQGTAEVLLWIFAGLPASSVPWMAWTVMRVRGRPKERWFIVVYPTLFTALAVSILFLNAYWTGQVGVWDENINVAGILTVAALLVHSYARILIPYGWRSTTLEPPGLPDLAPRP